ncbi:MAG: helix-turn-helix transcriptional regulator [Actinomycetota bacterium]|nr:helix-turn-helix transcriptional regulator [Actinomycetota bacterium]
MAAGSARPGLIMVSLVPLAAGWSALHGDVIARYRALSWLTDADQGRVGLPTALARTAAQALDALTATVYMGNEATLHAVGVWPDTNVDPAPSPLKGLPDRAWPVRSDGEVVGALVVPGVSVLTRSEEKIMLDLSAQAALLFARLTLAEVVQQERTAGHLAHLTQREREVLELMARGLSNAAICQKLHLSVKTVEPLISTVFAKLGLHADPAVNRRVLAALECHRG